eukprot:TRINITY_DN9405_c0_g3_i1.p2 TRINITY_DN9405_c0_g3~~TRINITY_DN9405_c0_g3_i1.p2  ORF type:complete len:152 (+),score=34.74 TRINITY_DN9405_c0_g3_i1:630-1085(+)
MSVVISSVFSSSKYHNMNYLRLLLIPSICFLLVQLVFTKKIEETPYHYYERGRVEDFKEKVQKFRMGELEDGLMYSKGDMKSLCEGWNSAKLLLACSLALMHHMSGASSIAIGSYFFLEHASRKTQCLCISNSAIALFFLVVAYNLIDSTL